MGVSFTNYLERLWDTELSMGLAICNSLTLSSDEIGHYMSSVVANQPTIREYGWVDPNTLKMTASSTPQALEVSLAGCLTLIHPTMKYFLELLWIFGMT